MLVDGNADKMGLCGYIRSWITEHTPQQENNCKTPRDDTPKVCIRTTQPSALPSCYHLQKHNRIQPSASFQLEFIVKIHQFKLGTARAALVRPSRAKHPSQLCNRPIAQPQVTHFISLCKTFLSSICFTFHYMRKL